MIYLLTAIGLTPGGSSTVHIYTQTVHRTTQLTNLEEGGPCPIFASYTLALALQLRKNIVTCAAQSKHLEFPHQVLCLYSHLRTLQVPSTAAHRQSSACALRQFAVGSTPFPLCSKHDMSSPTHLPPGA
jgi:hypothetical protein